MRCKNCTHTEFDWSENCTICSIFGWDNDDMYISENRKGEPGCKYNERTLEKFERINREAMAAEWAMPRKPEE